MSEVQIRIEGSDLPGRRCGEYQEIHVGVQRRNRATELLDLHPGDAPSAVWTIAATVLAKSGPELRGPYIQGGPGRRFIYLSWVTVHSDSTFTMFRRAKLLLTGIDPQVVAAAISSGHLVARLALTDAQGHPLCGRVEPPAVSWSTS